VKYNVVVTLEIYDVEADGEESAINLAYERIDKENFEGDIYIADVDAYEAKE